jgi:hypothetical protein
MTDGIWREARRRAWAETLDLLRLNEAPRAILTLGTPIVAIGVARFLSAQWATATIGGLAGTFGLGILIFLFKLLAAPAKLAAEMRSQLQERDEHQAEAESSRRREIVGRLVELYRLVAEGSVAPQIAAGLQLPPVDWMNEQLAEIGEDWQIAAVMGTKYQTIEFLDSTWKYRGTSLRTPMAVRWAVLFDELRVAWEEGASHVPEGVQAPTFYLPEMQIWVDVRAGVDGNAVAAMVQVVAATNRRALVAAGAPAAKEENLLFIERNGEVWDGRWALAEDRRDEGVYWITRSEMSAAILIGGPGKVTDHDRLPLFGTRLAHAFAAAASYAVS